MEKSKISICPECNEPLVYTFLFSGAEYYCLWCGHTCGMFGATSVESTNELEYKEKLYRDIYQSISKDIFCYGMWKKDCKECEPHTDENMHCKHADKEKDRIAREILDRLLKQ